MRGSTFRLVTLVVLATACGGGSGDPVSTTPQTPTPPTTPPATTPPVNQIGPPATVTIDAGDNQRGEPRRPLATRIRVTVKDSLARAVTGAAVTFAIDSGGGSLSATTATSASDGSAVAGDWTLGPSEGRNIMRVTVANLPPVRIAATATYLGVNVAAGSAGSGGGTLLVRTPGSALDSLTIQVPASALTGSVSFNVSASSSASLQLNPVAPPPAGSLRAGANARTTSASAHDATFANAAANLPSNSYIPITPVVTFTTDGPPIVAGEILLRIPIPAGVGGDLLVAVVDSARRPIAFLPALKVEPGAVTVSTRVLDEDVFKQLTPAPPPRTRKLSLVVFAIAPGLTLGQLYPSISSTYQLGKHSLDFPAIPTTLWSRIESGMVLLEWAAQYLYPSGINGVLQRAPGVWESNTKGLMLAAGLNAIYDRNLGQNYGPAWIQYYHDADPDGYTRSTVNALWWALWYGGGSAMPLTLTNGANFHEVLVLGWNAADQSFTVRDPEVPNATRKVAFVGARMQPYADPDTPNITYTIPYFASSYAYASWSTVLPYMSGLTTPGAASTFASSWPVSTLSSWDAIVRSPSLSVADTVFMVNDTSRLWTSMQNASIPVPSALPVPTGSTVQGLRHWLRDAVTGQWVFTPSQSSTSVFIDARSAVNPNPWYARTFGLASYMYSVPDYTRSMWDAWRRVDVVKYALSVSDKTASINTPVTFTITSPGGPTLPSSANYEWNFNDGTAVVRQAGPGPVTHSFPAGGTFAVDVRVYHGVSNQLIAKTRASAQVTGGYPLWKFTNVAVQIDQAGASPFEGPLAGILSMWTADLQRWTGIRDGATTGGLVYVARDTLVDGYVRLRGLYLIDSPLFTPGHINYYLRLPQPQGSSSAGPATQRVSLVNLLHPSSPPNPADQPAFNEGYAESGSLTTGSIAGTYWRGRNSQWLDFEQTMILHCPTYVSQGDVTFSMAAGESRASGTITVTARSREPNKQCATGPETRRWTIRVTFQAVRIQ